MGCSNRWTKLTLKRGTVKQEAIERLLLIDVGIEEKQKLTYLESSVNTQWKLLMEIKCEIGTARAAFARISPVQKNYHLIIILVRDKWDAI